MTTYQDQPSSRRAVREGDTGPTSIENESVDPAAESGAGHLAPGGGQNSPHATPLAPRGTPEPLSYVTQQRGPGSDAFRVQRPDRPNGAGRSDRFDDSALPSTQQIPTADGNGFRIRDYSPEGRTAVPSWAPTYTQTPNPFASRDGAALDYQTQARPDSFAARSAESAARAEAARADSAGAHGAHSAPPVPDAEAPAASGSAAAPVSGPDAVAPAAPVPTVLGGDSLAPGGSPAPASYSAGPGGTGERTITRRELRALREAQEAAEAAAAAAGTSAVAAPSSTEAEAPAPVIEPVAAEDAAVDDPPTIAPPPVAAPYLETGTPTPLPAEAESLAPAPRRPDVSPLDEVTVPTATPSAGPVALVEPPEPTRWSGKSDGHEPGSPSVFDALFTPPSQRDEPTPDEVVRAEAVQFPPAPNIERVVGATPEQIDPIAAILEPEPAETVVEPEPGEPESLVPETADVSVAEASPTVEEPASDASWTVASRPEPSFDELFQFEPAGDERVDLPAPSPADAPVSMAAPWDARPAEQAPIDEVVDAEVVAVIPAPEPVAPVVELKPIVIDATPLPAEPIERFEPPVGHWSTQTGDDAAPDNFISSRDVVGGHGVITTNALVLPSIPQPEFNNPLTSTGEILITGSIELPRSLAVTGSHTEQLDETLFDHELDAGDHQVVSTESAPVRAVRAVSTQTHSSGVIAGLKPRSNKSLTILIVATATMAVLAATLLVVGLMTGAFS